MGLDRSFTKPTCPHYHLGPRIYHERHQRAVVASSSWLLTVLCSFAFLDASGLSDSVWSLRFPHSLHWQPVACARRSGSLRTPYGVFCEAGQGTIKR